jgi:outer membrane protein OmpA-like peptidoglycan-associated protein
MSFSQNLRQRLGWLILTALVGLPIDASSQGADLQTFSVATGPSSIFSVEGTDTLSSLEPSAGLLMMYASRPLLEEFADGTTSAIIDSQLALHLYGGIGLLDWVQFDVDLPLYLINDGSFEGRTFDTPSVGDTHLKTKAQIIALNEGAVGIAGQLDLILPTGDDTAFIGRQGVGVRPRFLVDLKLGTLLIAANIGATLEESHTIRNIDFGPKLDLGIGLEKVFLQGLLLVGVELYGRTETSDAFATETTPVEALLGAKLVTDYGVTISAAGGGGIVSGVGAPEFRSLIGISWADRVTDFDRDGIPNRDDRCPRLPEDVDGFEDEDGCPDPDNDADTIPDTADACPDNPEDLDGFEDEDGCPDPDNDADGVPDEEDECREDPEDLDGFEDGDGCPDPDNDADGFEDGKDGCPDDPEDLDGFEDEDGCPDPDNDLDGIADGEDACPNEAGLPEDNGCPPKESKALRDAREIRILEKIFFEKETAVIRDVSYDVLNQVALVMRTNPDIRKVEIRGHTDEKGDEAYNRELSLARATSVLRYLIGRGLDEVRLQAVGFGETQPLVKSRTRKARAKNRRVEFLIVDPAPE